jgi:hypothetical protein
LGKNCPVSGTKSEEISILRLIINGIHFGLTNSVFHRILDFKTGWISILALFLFPEPVVTSKPALFPEGLETA